MKSCNHLRSEVRVGPYAITASGTQYLRKNGYEELKRYTLIVPLESNFELPFFGIELCVLMASIPDFHPPPKNWKSFLLGQLIPKLADGEKVITFCIGSHGRTGTLIASLIALLESEEETPDPIQAARERHCQHAVETCEQAEAVFALRGKALPSKYNSLRRAWQQGLCPMSE